MGTHLRGRARHRSARPAAILLRRHRAAAAPTQHAPADAAAQLPEPPFGTGTGRPTPLVFVRRRRPRGAPRPRPLPRRPGVRRRRRGLDELDLGLDVGGGFVHEHMLPVDLDPGAFVPHREAAAAADGLRSRGRGEIGGGFWGFVRGKKTGAPVGEKNGGRRPLIVERDEIIIHSSVLRWKEERDSAAGRGLCVAAGLYGPVIS